MNRQISSTITKETSTATVYGWNLNFIVESTNDGLKTIQCSGSKEGNYFSATHQEGGQISNSFTGGLDVALLSEVVAEFDAIVASFAAPVVEE